MPNVYLQKDLGKSGEIGNILHSYKEDIRKEFFKNNKHLGSEEQFTSPQPKETLLRTGILSTGYIIRWILKELMPLMQKVINKIRTGKWWGDTDYKDHMFVIGNWKMQPLIFNKVYVWKNDVDRYTNVENVQFGTVGSFDLVKRSYPKTTEMLEKIRNKYGRDSIVKATYSLLIAGGYIPVHKGLENHDSYAVRIHIPIIIPEHTKDQLFFECNGDIVYWTETFGFDNQAFHTARNKTNYNRLVFMVDISRKALDLPKQEKRTMPFLTRFFRYHLRLGKELN